MQLKRVSLASVLVGLGCCLSAVSAQADYLLNEDFNDNAASYTQSGAVTIRPVSDLIYTGVNNGFDSYEKLTGSFLVIGDYAGALNAGTPSGPNGNSTSAVAFNLGQFAAGSHSLNVAFDYVFDTNLAPGAGLARNLDDFLVQLLGSNGLSVDLLKFDDVSRNELDRRDHFQKTVNFDLATPQNVSLAFSLTEYTGTGDSAVGVDNISVIPEPTSLALSCAGLMGLLATRRRRLMPV